MKRLLHLLAAISLVAPPVFSQVVVDVKPGPPGLWQQLGTIKVSSTVNHDDIVFTGPAEFRSLKFNATDGAVNIVNANVIYQNGKVEYLNLKYLLRAGGETKVIDLKGVTGTQRIRRVTVWFHTDTTGNAQSAKLTLWGMK